LEFDFDNLVTEDITLYAKWEESVEPITLSINATPSGYPTSYGNFTWSFEDISFVGTELTKNGNAIQGNANRSPNSNITSNEVGHIQEIVVLVNTGNKLAVASAKFYVEVADNSNFTNSIKYGFGQGYTSTTNITLSSGTVTDVLTISGATITIDVSGDSATYVRFYWENGASYFTNIDVKYFPN